MQNSGFRYTCYVILKRVIDILGGLAGSLLTLPILLLVKIAYLIKGDKDRLLFSQERIGQYGKSIKIYKIRSMVKDADAVLEKLLAEDKAAAEEYEKYKKLKNDLV